MVVENEYGVQFEWEVAKKLMDREICKELDKTVLEFKNREIKGEYPFVSIDATYFKVREEQRVISKALIIRLRLRSIG